MKRVIIAVASLLLFSGGMAVAGELGNPAQFVQQGAFDVGLQWNSVFEQEFDHYELKRTYSGGYHDESRKEADFENDQYYLATVTYGILDRINVFARLGIVDGGKWVDHEAGNNWKGDLDSHFVWAIGAKGKVYEFDNGLGLGLAAQYMRYDDRKVKNRRSMDTGESAADLGWATDDRIDYWQLDAMAHAYWTMGAFTPYVGAGYTYYHVSCSGKWTHAGSYYGWIEYDASFHNKNAFTGLIGLDMDLGMNFKANIQGTFVSRTALTIGISYCF